MAKILKLRRLNFNYPDKKHTLVNLNFKVEKGEIVSVLGESGCGKSTLLKLIYGLEDAGSGEIEFDGNRVKGPAYNLVPGHPEMKLVPQEFDLLDFVSVSENVGKYLSNFNLPKKRKTINAALKAVDLYSERHELPIRISGGQRQRTAIARAMASEPRLLLLDEPFSQLDEPLKQKIRQGIRQWAKETGCTLLIATHDYRDAFGFSDRMIVLRKGRKFQIGTPEEVRAHPKNAYTASLLGEFTLLDAVDMQSCFGINIPQNSKAVIYPEEFEYSDNGYDFSVTRTLFRGRDYLVEAEHAAAKIKFYSPGKPPNSSVKISVKNFRQV